MFPILFQIDPIVFYSLWVSLTLGLFIGFLVIYRLTPLRKNKLNFIAQNFLLLFFSALIGARVVFVLVHYNYYLINFTENGIVLGRLLEALFIWDKGLSGWGAIIGFMTALFFLCRSSEENFASWSDIFLPSFILILAFTNFGALLDGRNYGTPTDLPWGITLLNSQFAVPIHPIQGYAAIYCLLIFFVLYSLFRRINQPGTIAWLSIGLYSFFRFLEEFLRGDETITVLEIRLGHIISLIALIIAVTMLTKPYWLAKFKNRKTP